MELYITIAIIVIGVFLFVKEYFSIDTTSILIMATFIVTGVLSPEEGFSGFNHPATITLGCIFVISGGIFKSGVMYGLSNRIVKVAKRSYTVALLTFCIISGLFSAFINDTAVVALLLPVALTVCREADIAPSRLLIPISFAALFGGTCTLIGTSTNILISSYAHKYGVEEFGMFEFSGAAICLMLIGLAYLYFFSPILLPKNRGGNEEFTKKAKAYITEILIDANCDDINKTLQESMLVKELNINVLSILRNNKLKHNFDIGTTIHQGDILKIMAPPETLSKLIDKKGISIKGYNRMKDAEEKFRTFNLYEVIIPFGSRLADKSLVQINFRRQYNASVIAIRQREKVKYNRLTNVNLREGDMLLVLAQPAQIDHLQKENLIIRLSQHIKNRTDISKAIPAVLIGLGVILAATFNIATILISAMIGALLMIVTGILKPTEAYKAVEWKVIFMMAGVLSMGAALEKSGGAKLIANYIEQSLGQFSDHVTLSLLYLVAFLSTNIISSKATAALLTPIVISLSQAMQISERPFLVAIMFACSLTFMTPISYPTNTMVYAPGNYKFNDFIKIGTPLNVLIWLAATLIIPYFFPF
ncbi:MAG: SLC13 family permease [Winogradskyella sp.]|nr:SLC13 family permease [Winogradskyella sp.]